MVVYRVLKKLILSHPYLLGLLGSVLVGVGTTAFYKPGFENILIYTGGAAILLSGPFVISGGLLFLPVLRRRQTGIRWIRAALLLFVSGLVLNLIGLVIGDLRGSGDFY